MIASRDILKRDSTRFANELDMVWNRKRGVEYHLKLFGLNNGKGVEEVHWIEKTRGLWGHNFANLVDIEANIQV